VCSSDLHTVRVGVAIARVSRRQLRQDRATMMAAALTYRTIFSLVPLLVLSLVIIKAFFGPQGIKDALTQLMQYTGLSELQTVSDDGSASITDWIERFVENASAYVENINYQAITIAGIALFIYAALSLFMMVEQSFNTVYRARQSRAMVRRVLSYWGLLTLGLFPLMMSIGLIEWLKQSIEHLPVGLAWASRASGYVASAAVTWLIFTAAYIVVPNSRVKLRPALMGACVSAILWEFAKGFLTTFVSLAVGRQVAVYGSLALVPIFMLWVYVTWLIVLFGLQISRIIQTIGTEGALRMSAELDGEAVFVSPASAVVLMRDFAKCYEAGKASTIESAARRCGLEERVVGRITDALLAAGLVLETSGEDEDASKYVPARPIETIKAAEVHAAVECLFTGGKSLEEDRRGREALAGSIMTPNEGSETVA